MDKRHHCKVLTLIKVIQNLKLVSLKEFRSIRGTISYLFISHSISFTSDSDFVRRILYGRHETLTSEDYACLQSVRKHRDRILWSFLGMDDEPKSVVDGQRVEEKKILTENKENAGQRSKSSPPVMDEKVVGVSCGEIQRKSPGGQTSVERSAKTGSGSYVIPQKRDRAPTSSVASNPPRKARRKTETNINEQEVSVSEEIQPVKPLKRNLGLEGFSETHWEIPADLLIGTDDDPKVQEWIKMDRSSRTRRSDLSPPRPHDRSLLPRQRYRLKVSALKKMYPNLPNTVVLDYIKGDESKLTIIALQQLRDAESYLYKKDPGALDLVKSEDDQEWRPDLRATATSTESRRSNRKR